MSGEKEQELGTPIEAGDGPVRSPNDNTGTAGTSTSCSSTAGDSGDKNTTGNSVCESTSGNSINILGKVVLRRASSSFLSNNLLKSAHSADIRSALLTGDVSFQANSSGSGSGRRWVCSATVSYDVCLRVLMARMR